MAKKQPLEKITEPVIRSGMSEAEMISNTKAFVKHAHEGVYCRGNGAPYHTHPFAVMKNLGLDAPIEHKLAALLHDVIEDTDYTRDDLLSLGFSEETITIVDLVTFDDDDPRPYITKIQEQVIDSGNEGAIRVKYADMCHNTHPSRIDNLEHADQVRKKTKYTWPKFMLEHAIAKLDAARGHEAPDQQAANSR